MPDPTATGARTRVALLASAGKAAEQLADAVRQAGAELVLSGDPATLDPAQLRAEGVGAVVIALEPRIESSLERFDDVLDDPAMLVVYDEADVAAHRTGWDAARWVRHLSAKLHGHDNVLPPGGEAASAVMPTPGQVRSPATRDSQVLTMAPFAEEATAHADAVPADAMPSGDADAFQAILAEADAMLAVEGLALDDATVQAPQRDAALDAMTAPMELGGDAFEGLGVDALEIEDRLAAASVAPAPRALAPDADDTVMAEIASATLQSDETPPALAGAGDAFDVGELDLSGFDLSAFQLDTTTTSAREVEAVPSLEDLLASAAPPADDAVAVPPPLPTAAPGESAAREPAAAAPQAPAAAISFANLSLADDDAPVAPVAAPAAPTAPAAPRHDLAELDARISSLSLVDLDEGAPTSTPGATPSVAEPPVGASLPLAPADDLPTAPVTAPLGGPPPLPPVGAGGPPPLPPLDAGSSLADVVPVSAAASATGVVLVEAGLGGPDPVRQLLAGLPARFPVPVLVRLPLQGGHYDRLVTQMSRAAAMPVVLAQAGQRAVPNTIHFLPDGVGLVADGAGVAFAAGVGRGENFDALPAGDAAVVFLSGADPDLVEAAMTAGALGALVAAQSPEDCYDGIACAGLRVRGVETALPAAIAAQLATRWPS